MLSSTVYFQPEHRSSCSLQPEHRRCGIRCITLNDTSIRFHQVVRPIATPPSLHQPRKYHKLLLLAIPESWKLHVAHYRCSTSNMVGRRVSHCVKQASNVALSACGQRAQQRTLHAATDVEAVASNPDRSLVIHSLLEVPGF